MRLTVGRQLALLVAIPLLAQAAVVCLIITLKRQSDAAKTATTRSVAISTRAYSVLDDLVALDTDVRTAFITRNPAFFADYPAAAEGLKSALDELMSAAPFNPEDKAILDQLAVDAVKKLAASAEIVSELRNDTPDREKVGRLFAEGQRQASILRRELMGLVHQSLAASASYQQGQMIALRRLQQWAVLGGFLTAALTCFAVAVFVQRIRRRLHVLTANTEHLACGEALAGPVGGSDELAALDAAFRQMASALNEALNNEKQARQAAQAASQAKSRFLASMSHELRTPLNAIIGFSEVLQDPASGSLKPSQQQYVRDIAESGKHLLSLINDLLDMSKAEAGKLDLQLSVFDLRSVIEQAVTLIAPQASQHHLRVSVNVEPSLEPIAADERKIKQVLTNLLSNAVKFTPDNGSVGVEALRKDGAVRVTVWDTGIGVAPADQPKVFQEFTQLDSAYGRHYAGTGLGLTLSKRFIERHGGRVWMESEGEGKGTRIHFTIPLKFQVGEA